MAKNSVGSPHPPARGALPLIHASVQVEQWLSYYWEKLQLPPEHMKYLAITTNRQEFAKWTGRRLQSMALGCYCYLPLGDSAGVTPGVVEVATERGVASRASSQQLALPGFEMGTHPYYGSDGEGLMSSAPMSDFRHLIFIEPGMMDRGVEVTVAHELIHLSDRVRGNPRKHHCHGSDSISMDEAAITGRDAETLRRELAEETRRREEALRRKRPYKYYYYCPRCERSYPRVRRYIRPVSCGHCFRQYNPDVLLRLRLSLDGPDVDPGFTEQRNRRRAPRDSLTA